MPGPLPEGISVMGEATRARFWVVTVATAAAMAITASLGFWQLDRAQQKLDLQAMIDQRQGAAPVTASELLAARDMSSLHFRQVRLRGTWDPAHTVYLDNRTMDGQTGFVVVTPFHLSGNDASLLVQRGWVLRNFQDRDRLPTLDTPNSEMEIAGHLAPPPSRYFELGESGSGPIRQNIDIAAFARETGVALLLDVSLQQSGDDASQLKRNWPHFAVDVHKHYGYAGQWFGLCALLGFLYVWFQIIQPRRRRRQDRDA